MHTLGAGSGYSQADVTAAAMVLTGLTIDRKEMDIAFRPNISEPGEHEVLGVSYGGRRRSRDDYLDMLDDLALHPKTAAHISHKLAVHFISDQPDEGMVSDMAEAWKKTDGDLTAVYTAMLDHPAAWRDEGRQGAPALRLCRRRPEGAECGTGQRRCRQFPRGQPAGY
ncbi:DUF1800 family protein [Rhizobium beringeri]